MNDETYFYDMLKASRKILLYTDSMSQDDFNSNELLQHAVIRLIQIIGEAARLVSAETKNTHPEIPWKQISGMRNHVIHRYFNVDLEIVWEVISQNLTPLSEQLEHLLQSAEDEDERPN